METSFEKNKSRTFLLRLILSFMTEYRNLTGMSRLNWQLLLFLALLVDFQDLLKPILLQDVLGLFHVLVDEILVRDHLHLGAGGQLSYVDEPHAVELLVPEREGVEQEGSDRVKVETEVLAGRLIELAPRVRNTWSNQRTIERP